MASGRATRGYHRVVTHVRGMPDNNATSKPDYPYQMVDGVGERDCSIRWDLFQPDVKEKRVLDLGTNMGYFAARSLQEGAAEVVAVDRNSDILESARKLHPEMDGRFVEMNLDHTLPEGEFDIAFCLSLWQHLSSGSRPLMDMLKRIPVVYWEDATLGQGELEAFGFQVERIGHSDRGRNLFKLTSEKVPA